MNFNGRVQKKSTKNFQLESEKGIIIYKLGDSIILQFGKINDTTFSLDFQMPLCPLQAFAICVSCLDSKFACEWERINKFFTYKLNKLTTNILLLWMIIKNVYE